MRGLVVVLPLDSNDFAAGIAAPQKNRSPATTFSALHDERELDGRFRRLKITNAKQNKARVGKRHYISEGRPMLAGSIGWILIVSGISAAMGGAAALIFPAPVVRLVCGVGSIDSLTMFFVRHWGALLFVVCALTAYSAFFPDSRFPILTAAIIEKAVVVLLIFFGSAKRTVAMTAIAIIDGTLAAVFLAYLAGL
jgi:hypothetical protein